MYYVCSRSIRLMKLLMLIKNLSDRVSVVRSGSPSRIRIVLRISFGITTRPRSSIRRTIPVAFIYSFNPFLAFVFDHHADAKRRRIFRLLRPVCVICTRILFASSPEICMKGRCFCFLCCFCAVFVLSACFLWLRTHEFFLSLLTLLKSGDKI